MNDFIYEVPVERVSAYQGQRLIVRARESAALTTTLADADPERIVGARLLSLAADSEPLNAWAPGLPVDLVMADPGAEFPLLYRHTELLDHHPVRVIIPVRPGFAKAVKVAVSLHFAVWLEPGQPDPALIEELVEVMAFYLRQPTVAQPDEFFTAHCWVFITTIRRPCGWCWTLIRNIFVLSPTMAPKACQAGWRASKPRSRPTPISANGSRGFWPRRTNAGAANFSGVAAAISNGRGGITTAPV